MCSLIWDTVRVSYKEASDDKHEGFMPADSQVHYNTSLLLGIKWLQVNGVHIMTTFDQNDF